MKIRIEFVELLKNVRKVLVEVCKEHVSVDHNGGGQSQLDSILALHQHVSLNH